MIEIPVDLPSELVPLSWLIGVWEGTGNVEYVVGEETVSRRFGQRVSFSHDGLPYLNYTSYTWLDDDERTPLVAESGYWRLHRTQLEGDPGPAMLPPTSTRPFTTAQSVETLRNSDGGFDLEVALVHQGGVSELYRRPRPGSAHARVRPPREGGLMGVVASSPFAFLPGAVLPEAVSTEAVPSESGTEDVASPVPVPLHYGDPFREQRELEAGRAIVDASDLGIVALAGDDRRQLLHALTSQDLAHLAPGDSAETLVLDPQGRVEYAAHVLDDGVTSWLIVDPGLASSLATFFDRMRFMLRVEVSDRSDDFAVVSSAAEIEGLPVAAPSGVPLTWRDPWSGVVAGGWQYAEGAHPGTDRVWFESIVARDRLAEAAALVSSGSVGVAGSLAAEALRIAAWRPRQSLDADERTIPHELDWIRTAVHLEKGCYRGQETVAKVHNLGRPPRRVVMLHLDGSDSVLPPHGAEISAEKDGEAREVGRVTSSAIHHDLGPIALAVVKRAVPIDAPLSIRVGDTVVAAAQQAIVPPGAGATADVPRLPRLGRG